MVCVFISSFYCRISHLSSLSVVCLPAWSVGNYQSDKSHDPPSRYRYLGYAKDRAELGYTSAGEKMSAFLSLCQCLLLGTFAAILGAHRSQILDKNGNPSGGGSAATGADDETYEPPRGDFA